MPLANAFLSNWKNPLATPGAAPRPGTGGGKAPRAATPAPQPGAQPTSGLNTGQWAGTPQGGPRLAAKVGQGETRGFDPMAGVVGESDVPHVSETGVQMQSGYADPQALPGLVQAPNGEWMTPEDLAAAQAAAADNTSDPWDAIRDNVANLTPGDRVPGTNLVVGPDGNLQEADATSEGGETTPEQSAMYAEMDRLLGLDEGTTQSIIEGMNMDGNPLWDIERDRYVGEGNQDYESASTMANSFAAFGYYGTDPQSGRVVPTEYLTQGYAVTEDGRMVPLSEVDYNPNAKPQWDSNGKAIPQELPPGISRIVHPEDITQHTDPIDTASMEAAAAGVGGAMDDVGTGMGLVLDAYNDRTPVEVPAWYNEELRAKGHKDVLGQVRRDYNSLADFYRGIMGGNDALFNDARKLALQDWQEKTGAQRDEQARALQAGGYGAGSMGRSALNRFDMLADQELARSELDWAESDRAHRLQAGGQFGTAQSNMGNMENAQASNQMRALADYGAQRNTRDELILEGEKWNDQAADRMATSLSNLGGAQAGLSNAARSLGVDINSAKNPIQRLLDTGGALEGDAETRSRLEEDRINQLKTRYPGSEVALDILLNKLPALKSDLANMDARRAEQIVMLAASLINQNPDLFEDMSPEQIQEWIDTFTG